MTKINIFPPKNERGGQHIWKQGWEKCHVTCHGWDTKFCGEYSFYVCATVRTLHNNNNNNDNNNALYYVSMFMTDERLLMSIFQACAHDKCQSGRTDDKTRENLPYTIQRQLWPRVIYVNWSKNVPSGLCCGCKVKWKTTQTCIHLCSFGGIFRHSENAQRNDPQLFRIASTPCNVSWGKTSTKYWPTFLYELSDQYVHLVLP